MAKCQDPNCYNYDTTNHVFCGDCLILSVQKMSEEELYDIFLEGDRKIVEAMQDGEAHGVLHPEDRRLINKFKHRWFRLINNFMLTKNGG